MINNDNFRRWSMSAAEFLDSFRVVPRLIVAGYGLMMWVVVKWYMGLEPHVIEGCDIATLGEVCVAGAPATQHAALVTAIVGVAAAVFGLYANSGRDWSNKPFMPWNKKDNSNNSASE